jgi:hypothetical protein
LFAAATMISALGLLMLFRGLQRPAPASRASA